MQADTTEVSDMGALRAGAAALGIALDDGQVEQFAQLRAMLLDENERVNLTAITDPAEVVSKHFLDSLACALAVPQGRWNALLALLDVGSGAGFPGLALAIAFPHWRVTSLDATRKKTRFQEAVVEALKLRNVRVIAGRAEELGRAAAWRAHYDVVTARALSALPTLLEYCAPFARVGGYVVAPKKGDLADEIVAGARAAELLGAHLLDPIPVTVPPLDDGRVLLVARQARSCPAQYPRAAGAPVKHPLGRG